MFAMQRGHIALFFPFLSDRFCCLFQISGQPIERAFPELSILLDPLRGFFERLGVQLHFVDAPVAPAPKQSGFFQNAQMLRDRGQATWRAAAPGR